MKGVYMDKKKKAPVKKAAVKKVKKAVKKAY
jgi:hypothetical protein